MGFNELVKILRTMYNDPLYSQRKHQGIVPILFGIHYADEINDCGYTPKKIAEEATGKDSYGAEINKGMRLAQYVKIRPDIKL